MEAHQLTIPGLLGYLGFAVCETEFKELVRASACRDQLEALIIGPAGNQAGGLTVHLYCGVYRGWV